LRAAGPRRREWSSTGGCSSFVLRDAAGTGSKAREVRSSEGRKPKSSDRWLGATRVWRERIREGRKASKRVKLVEGSDPVASGPERPGSGLRFVIKGVHSLVGIQATASKAWASVKLGAKGCKRRTSARRWITAGELVARKRTTILTRGTL
jgi:hypothetical protein